MSSEPVLRSAPKAIDPQDYMLQVVQAQKDSAQLQMDVQTASADPWSTVRNSETLGKGYAELQARVQALQSNLKSVKVETFVREALSRDVGELALETAALGKRCQLLSREIALRNRLTVLSEDLARTSAKGGAASSLRTRGSQLFTQMATQPDAITTSLTRQVLAMQTRLYSQAAQLEGSGSSSVARPKLQDPATLGLSTTHRRGLQLQGSPSVSVSEVNSVKTNPGKFLHAMVKTLREKDFRKNTQEMQKWLDLCLCLPKEVKREIFSNFQAASTLKEPIEPKDYTSELFRDDLRIYVDAIRASTPFKTYQEPETGGDAPSKKSSAPTGSGPSVPVIPTSSSSGSALLQTASVPSDSLALAASTSRTASSFLSSASEGGTDSSASQTRAPESLRRAPSSDPMIADMPASARWREILSLLDTRCSAITSRHERTLFLHNTFFAYGIPDSEKADIYVRLANQKDLGPKDPALNYSIVLAGRLGLGRDLSLLRSILQVKMEEALKQEHVLRAKTALPSPKTPDPWASLIMARQAVGTDRSPGTDPSMSGPRPSVSSSSSSSSAMSSPLQSSTSLSSGEVARTLAPTLTPAPTSGPTPSGAKKEAPPMPTSMPPPVPSSLPPPVPSSLPPPMPRTMPPTLATTGAQSGEPKKEVTSSSSPAPIVRTTSEAPKSGVSPTPTPVLIMGAPSGGPKKEATPGSTPAPTVSTTSEAPKSGVSPTPTPVLTTGAPAPKKEATPSSIPAPTVSTTSEAPKSGVSPTPTPVLTTGAPAPKKEATPSSTPAPTVSTTSEAPKSGVSPTPTPVLTTGAPAPKKEATPGTTTVATATA